MLSSDVNASVGLGCSHIKCLNVAPRVYIAAKKLLN